MPLVSQQYRDKVSGIIRELHGLGWNDRMIASELGFSTCTVLEYRKRLGLAATRKNTPGVCRSDNQIHPHRERILELHQQNWSDGAIAREIGVSRRQLAYYRQQNLKLPAVPRDQDVHRAEARRSQERTLGMNPSELRAVKYWKIAESLGWEYGIRFRSVQVLEYLLTQPDGATREQIAEALNVTASRLKSNDPQGTSLANLIARGLVAAASRVVPGTRPGPRGLQGQNVNLYFATPTAFEIKALWRLSHSSEVERELLAELSSYGRRTRRGRNSREVSCPN